MRGNVRAAICATTGEVSLFDVVLVYWYLTSGLLPATGSCRAPIPPRGAAPADIQHNSVLLLAAGRERMSHA